MVVMGVYEVANLYNGKATAYVGSSNNIRLRWQNHKAMLRGDRHTNPHLQAAWNLYGEDAFEWNIIEEVAEVNKLLEREQYWLNRYFESPDTCYNIARDASAPMQGRRFSEEHKRKLSEALRGNTYALGYRHTDEHNKRISEALKGRKKSPEWRRRISEVAKKRKHTVETKRKIGEACNRAMPYPSFTHNETGETIPAGVNLAKCCRKYGLDPSHMRKVANGLSRHHKGWILTSNVIEGVR